MMNSLAFLMICLASFQYVSAFEMIMGGRTIYDLNQPGNLNKIEKLSTYGVKTLAERRMEAAKKNNQVSTSSKPLEYNHRVISAQSQVVAGIKYYIDIKMNDANCRKLCAVEKCQLVIWERGWENFINLTSFNCETNTEENQLMGLYANPENANKGIQVGEVKKTEIDESSQAALDRIVTELNAQINSNYVHKLTEVISVKKQMVAGFSYSFEFSVGKTTCEKTPENLKSTESCEIQADTKPMTCTGSVWDRVWMPERYQNIDFTCQNTV